MNAPAQVNGQCTPTGYERAARPHLALTGTHTGEFMGMPPTGRRVSQRQMHILRMEDGKAAEHWAVRDDLGMLQQLGVIPEPNR